MVIVYNDPENWILLLEKFSETEFICQIFFQKCSENKLITVQEINENKIVSNRTDRKEV